MSHTEVRCRTCGSYKPESRRAWGNGTFCPDVWHTFAVPFELRRPSWDQYFMDLAKLAAKRATCPVRSVGSVFVDPVNRVVLATGYNGAPRGLEHCGEACFNRQQGQNTGECRAVHSETNAIYSAARMGTKLDGSHVYCTLSPCLNCARAMIQVGVKSIIWAASSVYSEPLEELKNAGIEFKTIGE